MKGIGEHKDELVNTLVEKQVIARMEEMAEEETKQEIIMALEGMTSAITSGHDNVASSFTAGSNDIKEAMEESSDNLVEAIEDGNSDLSSSISNGLTSLENEMRISMSDLSGATADSFEALSTAIRQALHCHVLTFIIFFFCRDFSSGTSESVDGIIDALNVHKTILEQGKDVLDNGFDNIKTELGLIQIEIQSAASQSAQLGAIRRLADKIECTEDCFMSDDQAAAILDGLSQNGQNIASVISDVGNTQSSSAAAQARIKQKNRNRR